MKKIGVICEYNPFHLGHKFQIEKIKEMYEDSIIISLCSSTFTQRGDVSIINKWDKATIALNNGIDLFIEFPYAYASQGADIFAKGAIEILNKLNIDAIVFGCETMDSKTLINLANIQLNNQDYNNKVQNYLDKGLNYATALSKSLYDISKITIDKPNDILGLSYVREIIKNNYNIEIQTIKRINNYHNDKTINNIASATHIRNLLNNNKDITKHIVKDEIKYINNYNIESFFPYLKYQIINNKTNLSKYLEVDEGIENRIIKYINTSNNWHELVMNIKTKRYTYNKINRMLLHILTSFTKEEAKLINNNYIRVLGFNKKGQKYLKEIKKNLNIITNYKNNLSLTLDIEYRITCIYSLVLNNNLAEKEISHNPIIMD